VTTQVIILNGGSSSGKSGIARCLQAVLPDPWLAFGTDTLTEAMPASMQTSTAGIQIAPDGEVSIGPEFRALEAAWIEGIAAMGPGRSTDHRRLGFPRYYGLPAAVEDGTCGTSGAVGRRPVRERRRRGPRGRTR